MREAFIKQATKLGYEVIDMNSVFREEYTIKQEKFEHESDNHWNSLGHFLVAREIGKSKTFKAYFKRAKKQSTNTSYQQIDEDEVWMY